jgi:deoxyguanosine kinase
LYFGVKLKILIEVINKDGMNVVFLGLGGNIGNRVKNLEEITNALKRDCGEILAKSGIYETEAWGAPSENKYLNQVVKLRTSLSSKELIKKILVIEANAGRKRKKGVYLDRTADIDILFFNKDVVDSKHLKIPHPRLHLRKFVLVPLHEIEKEFVHPVLKKNISQLLKECKDKLEVRRFELHKPLRYISIEGNIGSGKTTLAKALSKKRKAEFVAEKFEENNLLPLFYGDPKLYAFPLEYSFLISRFEQLTKVLTGKNKLVISDFSIYKCLWFAKVNLRRKEYLLFKKHFSALTDQLPEPDLIVYLTTELGNLSNNIKKRGRPYEQKIPENYLKSLDKEYRRGISLMEPGKVLILQVKKYHSKLEIASIKVIENYIKENFGQAT